MKRNLPALTLPFLGLGAGLPETPYVGLRCAVR